MSSIERMGRKVLAAGVLALASHASAEAATIVVRSNGPSAASYPPGKPLTAGQITLKAGDSVTVLDAKGTRVLKGPGNVAVSGSGAATVNGIAALIADTGVRQTRTGATRGNGDGKPHPTNVWMVDASHGGPFCVANAERLSVWRPDNAKAGKLAITRVSDGKTATLNFLAGESIRAWPAEILPVGNGAKFRLDLGTEKVAPTLVARVLPAAPASLDEVASTLVEKGCDGQIDLLVDLTAAEDE